MSNYLTKFIVFEGLDGSGQTTQGQLLVKFLKERKQRAIFTQNPTTDLTQHSKYASKIDGILNGDEEATAKELQSLFIKDRKWHMENVVKPALDDGKHVVCDRYKYSTIAYGVASGVDKDYLVKEQEDFLEPDLTIFLRVKPKICVQRIKERGDNITIFEKEEKLRKIEKVYDKLIEEYDMEVINGELSLEKVSRRVQSVVMKNMRI